MSTPEPTTPALEAPVEAQEAPVEAAPEADPTPEPAAPLDAHAAEIRKLRDENAKRRTQLRETEERVKALEREKLSESERVLAERDEAVAALATAREHARIEGLAAAAVRVGAQVGLVDPDDAIRLIPADQFTYDEHGRPSNVEELVRGLVADKPYLAKQSGPRRPDAGLVPGGQQTGPHPVPVKEETLAERRARIASGGRPGGADGLSTSGISNRGGGVWMDGKNLLTGGQDPGSAA